jgi:valyl-tRNA synthetase
MPFVTEEIYHALKDQSVDLCVKQIETSIMVSNADAQILKQSDLLKTAITAIRDARVKAQIKNKDVVTLYCTTKAAENWTSITNLLCKQVNAVSLQMVDSPVADTIQLVIGGDRFYVKADKELDTTAQKAELENDLNYYIRFLESVEKKLSNERFVQNAKPEVVELERKKQSDAQEKIKLLQESLRNLS